MKIKFRSNIFGSSQYRGATYYRITVPANFCRKYCIKLGDVYLIKINRKIFPITITGDNNSKNIPISIRISRGLDIKSGSKVLVTIISKGIEARGQKRTIERGNEEYLDLLHAAPKNQIHTNKQIYVFNCKNSILVYSKGSSRPVKLPRYLKISEFMAEIFGLYQAEGYKKLPKISGARLEFTNSDPAIVAYFLKFLENDLSTDKTQIKAYINCYNFNLTHKELVDYWSNAVGIPEKNFQKTRFLTPKGKKMKEYGTLHILVLSSVFVEVFLGIMGLFLKSLIKRNDLNAAFLRGLLAGDGHVKLAKYKNKRSLQMVELSLENDREAEIYRRLLSNIAITSHYYPYSRKIVITSMTNFEKLAKFRLLDLSNEKRINFWSGYNQHRRLTFKS